MNTKVALIATRATFCLLAASILFYGYIAFFPKRYIGDLFFDSGSVYNIAVAEFFYRQSARFETTNEGKALPYTHYQLGRIYFVAGDFKSAYRELYRELELYPENKHTYYILGLVYGYDNQETKAIEAFNRFLKYKPVSWAARNDLAWLQFRVGDVDGAIETIKPALLYPDKNPWVYNTYGVLHINKGEHEIAQQYLSEALAMCAKMTSSDWGVAYPGNHPSIHQEGLSAMIGAITENLAKAEAGIPIEVDSDSSTKAGMIR